ncbi:MarR family winged helix-turn-helix transcriptional regulator [Nocardia stercoris]|uniref:MarR family transcriptional regulator n=1 Tax=Nocardia stercoris TaxID=2483361 RepID=A0A3M2LBQ2_9NOCA|nr:MarR family winged helix-turn-helix transcriptional regulator [Nocardia stercoris]RMI32108.1 MarR family transcriptional regulator [Nocardia stercoris]
MNSSTTTHTSAADHEPAAGISLALDNQLCFALYAASRLVAAAYRPFLDEMGLTYPQYLVMLALWEQPGSSMKQLCARLSLNYGTVSPLVKRLVAAGLVESDPAGDKRAVVLRPSAVSWALQDQSECMIESVTSDVGLPPEQLSGLRDEVNDLARRLAAAVRARSCA